MTLTNIEYKTFLEAHLRLLFFVGQQSKIIDKKMDFTDFVETDFSVKLNCRNYFLDNKKLLDDYISTHFDELTTEQIKILAGFNTSISSDFIIFKCLKNHAIFIDTKSNTFYEVKALGDRFDHFFDRIPILVEATILPFNNQIVYDGFLKPTRITLGSGITSILNEDYKRAKSNNQIVMTIGME